MNEERIKNLDIGNEANKEKNTPSKIYKNFTEQKINKKEVIEAIISILETSDSKVIRIDGLEILKKLRVKSNKTFKIIENYLISDEEWEVRIKAIQILINLFPKKCLKPLKWAIRREFFPIVFREVINSIKLLDIDSQNTIMNYIITKYVKIYDITPHEAKFIIDLDCEGPYGQYNKPIRFQTKKYRSVKEIRYYLDRLIAVNNKHIIGLNIHRNINKIPESIQNLKKLRYFHILTEKDVKIPKSIELLPRLREFRIYSKTLIKIPPKLAKRARNYFRRKYIWNGVSPDDALILASLDIIGLGLENIEYEDLIEYFDSSIYNYDLDAQGNVISISIMPWGSRSMRKSFFPEEICSLKYLQELNLWGDKIEAIPESIVNLESMRKLYITNNEQKIKIPKSVISFLKSLEFCEIE